MRIYTSYRVAMRGLRPRNFRCFARLNARVKTPVARLKAAKSASLFLLTKIKAHYGAPRPLSDRALRRSPRADAFAAPPMAITLMSDAFPVSPLRTRYRRAR